MEKASFVEWLHTPHITGKSSKWNGFILRFGAPVCTSLNLSLPNSLNAGPSASSFTLFAEETIHVLIQESESKAIFICIRVLHN